MRIQILLSLILYKMKVFDLGSRYAPLVLCWKHEKVNDKNHDKINMTAYISCRFYRKKHYLNISYC